jgi:lysophospholipase L1-like esterase
MGSAAAWWWRGLAILGAACVLLGISLVVAAPNSVPATGSALPPPASEPTPVAAETPPPADSLVVDDADVYIPMEERPLAVFLGDSITRGMTEPTAGVGEHSWFHGLVDDTAGVVRWGGTVAENGMTTAWMVSQVWNALYPTPDLLIVHGGTNDVSGEITPPVVVNNLERIRLAAESAGVPLAVCTLPPRADPAADARAVAVNAAIRTWADANDVILLDTGTPVRDPVLGGWLPGYSTDGLHPTPQATAVMSESAAGTLRRIPLGV